MPDRRQSTQSVPPAHKAYAMLSLAHCLVRMPRDGTTCRLLLAVFLLPLLVLCHGADPSRDIVIVFDYSEYSRPAVEPLQRGFARFLSVYDSAGETVSPSTFYLYEYENRGALETVVASSDPELVLEGIASLTNTTITCSDHLCCSTGLTNYFPDIFDQHKGAIIFLIVDCFYQLPDDVENKIYREMQRTGTTIVFVQITDSYAGGGDYNFQRLFFTELRFRVNTQNIGNVFFSILAHYRSQYGGTEGNSWCLNSSFYARVSDNVQAFMILVIEGQPRRSVEVFDPEGRSLANSTATLFSDPTGATAIFLYAGCEPGWNFSEGRCYKRNSRRMTYDRASAACREQAATLLTEDADIDFKILEETLKWAGEEDGASNSTFVWLDLTDWNPKKQFYWRLLNNKIALSLTGKTRWANGEPRRMTPGSRCVYLDIAKRTWFVSYCQSLLSSVCVKNAYQLGGNGINKNFLAQGRYGRTGTETASTMLLITTGLGSVTGFSSN